MEGHYASSEIESRLRGLSEERERLHSVWGARQEEFVQCHKLQLFLRDAEQREGWLTTQEGFLANEDLGVSGDAPLVTFIVNTFPVLVAHRWHEQCVHVYL